MYKVMLLDDEPWELKGITNMIPWKDYGFQIQYALSNPLEAFTILQTASLDVLLSDIRMPGMDGIQLLQKLRETNIQTTVLFLSGHAEFDYARNALRAGAFDYLLKPIDLDNTGELLERLLQHLEEKKQLSNLLIMDKISSRELCFTDIFPHEQDTSHYCILIGNHISEMYMDTLTDVRTCCLSTGPDRFLCLAELKDKTAFIQNLSQHITDQAAGIYITTHSSGDTSHLADSGSNNLPSPHGESLAHSSSGLSQMISCAETAYLSSFLTGRPELTLYFENDIAILKQTIHQLNQYYDSAKMTELHQLLLTLPALCEKRQVNSFGFMCIWNQVLLHCLEDSELYEEYCLSDIHEFPERFSGFDAFLAELEIILENCQNDGISPPPVSNTQELYNTMVEYIRKHYQSPISLKNVADHTHLSFTYASKLFKKYANMNYTKYLSDLRIKEACRLLVSTSQSIEEICFRTGYNDYFYFNKAFKKNMGMTPLQYRKKV